jgi:hypothetical protein
MTETIQTCAACGGELPHDASACPWCGAVLGDAEPPKKKSWMPPLWARLGCLGLVVAFLLVIAVIIPSSLGAPQRTRQRRTMGDVRSLAVMVASYEVDNKKVPVPSGAPPAVGWRFVPVAEIKPFLVPDYGTIFPDKDVFEAPVLYGYTGEDPASFCLIATGSDRRRDSDALPEAEVKTRCYESDIIWVNDAFLQFPEGPQAKCRGGFAIFGD